MTVPLSPSRQASNSQNAVQRRQPTRHNRKVLRNSEHALDEDGEAQHPSRLNNEEPSSAWDRLQFYQKFARVWASALTAPECMVMLQIVDRTVGWGVQSIEITTSRLRQGDGLYRGIGEGVSRRTLFRVLTELEAKGCIVRETERDRVVISINTCWKPEVIAIPKRLKGNGNVQPVAAQPDPLDDDRCQSDTDQCHSGTAEVSEGHSLNRTGGIEPTEENTAYRQGDCAREDLSGEEPVQIARMKNIDAGTGKLRKSKADPQAVWRNACIETFPGIVPEHWSIKDQGRAKTARKAFVISSGHSFEDFLQWTVEHWSTIIAKKFRWMTDQTPPTVPRIGFVIGMYTHFLEAFGTWVYETWLSDKDRTELEKLKAKGLSHDEALIEIGKQVTARQLRREMSKREAEMQRVAAGARADRQAAEKVRTFNERYGSSIPLHPKSRCANEQYQQPETWLDESQKAAVAIPGNLRAPKVNFDE